MDIHPTDPLHDAPPGISLVIPTRNEADNIDALLERVGPVLPRPAEVLFVDDSDDDTPARVLAAADANPDRDLRISLLHRPTGQREGGLGSAVAAGLAQAHHPWACVMDADLQHPPERVPDLLRAALAEQADVVVASRYCSDGDAAGLRASRAAVSQASTVAARVLFPRRLRGVSDPMSGFFLVRRASIRPDLLQARGFKILLELLLTTPGLRVAEVAYTFGERHAGTSKASVREGITYLTRLGALRLQGNRTAAPAPVPAAPGPGTAAEEVAVRAAGGFEGA